MRIALLMLVACVPSAYQPGTIPHATELACLDVGAAIASRSAAGIVVAWKFGNRCEHHVVVDLGSVRVAGIDRDDRLVALAAYDPRHEIRPLSLVARGEGEEQIEYDPPAPTRADELAVIAVELGGIDAAQPIHRELRFSVAP